jgi:hypothetical protein
MLPSLMTLTVPDASSVNRVTSWPSTCTWPISSTTFPRISRIGSSVKPNACSIIFPEISMKKTRLGLGFDGVGVSAVVSWSITWKVAVPPIPRSPS